MKKTFIFAFKKSIPVMLGYLFMGFAAGILMSEAGFGWIWSFASSASIISGTMQFIIVDFFSRN